AGLDRLLGALVPVALDRGLLEVVAVGVCHGVLQRLRIPPGHRRRAKVWRQYWTDRWTGMRWGSRMWGGGGRHGSTVGRSEGRKVGRWNRRGISPRGPPQAAILHPAPSSCQSRRPT